MEVLQDACVAGLVGVLRCVSNATEADMQASWGPARSQKETVKFWWGIIRAVVSQGLFQGFLQKAQGSAGAASVAVTTANVCHVEAGSCRLQKCSHGNVLEQGKQKVSAGSQRTAPRCLAGWPGRRVWGEDVNLEHREGRGAVRLQIQGIEDVVGAAWQTRSPKLQWGMRLLGESSEGGM